MDTTSRTDASATRAAVERSDGMSRSQRIQLPRWGGVAGLAGVVLMLGSFAVVVALGLPDASDAATLTDFADIEPGRIAEHFLYLGALMLFALHVLVLHRLLATAHPAAALFGTAVAEFGFVTMAASSMLHVSTAPLAALYAADNTSAGDLRAIEYGWVAAQSVFDTMLTTGVLLVPIGIVLLGVAMRSTSAFGPRLTMVTLGLGTVGIVGAVISVLDPGSMFAAASVLAITVFHFSIGWRTLTLSRDASPLLSAS
jgi:hypothetical protein